MNIEAGPSSSGNPFDALKNLEEVVEEGEIGDSVKQGTDMQGNVVVENILEVQIKDTASEETLPQEFRSQKIHRNLESQTTP